MLQRLGVRGCFMCGVRRKMQCLATASAPQLAHLDLRDNDVTNHFHWLAQASWPQLTSLTVSSSFDLAVLPQAHPIWEKLQVLTVMRSQNSLDEIFAMVTSPGQALSILHVESRVSGIVQARPAFDSWPQNSQLDLKVPFMASTLESIGLGWWPITTLQTRDTGIDSIMAMEALVRLHLPVMESFSYHLMGSMQDDVAVDVCAMCQGVVRASWPALKRLDFGVVHLDDVDTSVLASARWPLLESIQLTGHFGALQQIEQLVHGNWPHLKCLTLPRSFDVSQANLQPLLNKWPVLNVNHAEY